MKGRTQGQYDELQEQIRAARLNDFKDWVEKHGDKMQQANEQGDVRSVYKSVEALAGKKQRPPKNLTSDGQGSMLQSAADVAQRWYDFLSKKFAATEAENTQRPAMPILPHTVGQGGLTTEEVLEGLKKMQKDKATGPDKIPIAVFKHCPMCKSLLVDP